MRVLLVNTVCRGFVSKGLSSCLRNGSVQRPLSVRENRKVGMILLALLALLSTSSVAVAFYGKGRNKTARTLEYFELNKRLLQMIRNSLCKLKIWSALINAYFTCHCRSRFLSCKEEKTLQTRLVRSFINWCPVSSWRNVIWRVQDRRTKQHWKTYLRSCQLFLVCCCFSIFSTIFSMHHAFASSSYCGLHWRCGKEKWIVVGNLILIQAGCAETCSFCPLVIVRCRHEINLSEVTRERLELASPNSRPR